MTCEVSAGYACCAGRPAGRVPDLTGPEICSIEELARTYLTAVGKRRPIVSVPLPERVCRAYRAGGHLAPDRAVGTIAFEQYLGELPHDDAIRDCTRRPPRKQVRGCCAAPDLLTRVFRR